MADRDNTDELPAVTEVITPVDRRRGSRADAPGAATEPVTPSAPDGPSGFARARRRALVWDAGYSIVSGLVLLVLYASDRPIESLPDWSSLVVGVAVVFWSGILAAIAAGGVGRAATALVGLVNIAFGAAVFTYGWFDTDIPALVVVVAAQVIGIGLVQLVASLRR